MTAKWEIIPMGQLCSIKSGKSDTQDAVEDGPYAFFDRSRTIKRSSRYLYDCEALIIPGEGTEFLPKHFIGKFDLHQRAYALSGFSARIDVKFLYYFLHHVCDYFPRVAVGATVKSLRLRHFEQLPVSVTGLPEQQRIVGILDAAFGGISTAKANAEKNLQNAHELFESHLNSVFTQRGDGWQNVALAETCEMFADGDWIESKDQSPAGIRLIQTGNVGIGEFKNRIEQAHYISEATFKRLRCTEIFEGDCLVSRLPDPVGRSCLLPNTGDRMITAVDCTILRFKKTHVIPSFFVYYSQSQDYLRAVNSETTGTTRNRISRNNLGHVAIPLAPIANQIRIVASLDPLLQETQRLESIYQQKLDTLEEFKKSLLQQAFNGEL